MRCPIAALICVALSSSLSATAHEPKTAALATAYQSSVQPLIERYCIDCHGAVSAEGEIDLAGLTAWDDAARHATTWQRVAEMLHNRLMPPADTEQPSAEELATLEQWVRDLLALKAGERAGDPGRVILRRLSNAEYTNTLRDLTGVASLEPAREFPADGAAGEGFTNAGAALVMSPELVDKYFRAAKEIASHAVLLPDGFRFSPHTTSRDWTDDTLAEIRQFYSEFTEASGGSEVNLQGIVFETNSGGRLPLEKYLMATIEERDALTSGRKSINVVARERGLNARYLNILWTNLHAAKPSQLLRDLCEQWQTADAGQGQALTQAVVAWQGALWTFAAVGLIGREGGPNRWMEPVNPLVARQEFRVKIPETSASPDSGEVLISLVVSDAGDGGESDLVVWQAPRLVSSDGSEVLLRDVSIAGFDPAQFGRHPDGREIDRSDLCVQAPAVIELRLPAAVATGREFVTTGVLDAATGSEGSVQLAVVAGKADIEPGLHQGQNTTGLKPGESWSGAQQTVNSAPILVNNGSAAEGRFRQAFEDFRQLFPAALCYTKIVPVDEVVTATLFFREDDHLARLMLDDAQRERLDRLWNELHFVSRDALTSVDALDQLLEFATQDADPHAFEPMREPIAARAAAFRQQVLDAESTQVDALIDFAARAYRRPLDGHEADELRGLYAKLRGEEIPHEEAFRLTLARLLVAPAFLYRVEKPVTGAVQGPVTTWELANRLSYFLWASQPDDELRQAASSGYLEDPAQLVEQARRMLGDSKSRRLATEFACHWLQINGFELLDEKSERHFPEFGRLRSSMAEESIQFFTDLFQSNGSVLDILDADYTFLNEDLAQHYGIPGVTGPQWRRVDGVKKFSRGGVLAQATTLAKQSGASRTSPILRGIWISEVLLGERLPKPPPGVPPLPDDEADTDGLTVRQLVEKHTSDPKCAVCHRRIDPYGFSLEAFDAIGRLREHDLGDRPIDTRVVAMDGSEFDGLAGVRQYLLTQRRDAFTRQFCRKLLGYALGRSVQLSDDPLLTKMQRELAAQEFKVHAAIETIVRSRQFREIRGMDTAFED